MIFLLLLLRSHDHHSHFLESGLLSLQNRIMKVIVRDYLGCNYEVDCLSDDTIGVCVEQYKRLRRDGVLDETQYQYVVRGAGGVVLETTQVLGDIGLSDESTLRIDTRKMRVEFLSIDFEVEVNFKNVVIRGGTDMERIMNKLERCRNLIDKFGDDDDKHYFSRDGPIEQQMKECPKVYDKGWFATLGHKRANTVYLNWLSHLANDGWEIVNVYYHCSNHVSNMFPKILFKRQL